MIKFDNGYKPLCPGLVIGEGIQGNGVFTVEDFKAGIFLGETHIWCSKRRDWIRTPLGGFLNHSDNPNCFVNTNIHYHHGDQRELYTIRPITKGEELTIYYTLQEYYD